jgi:hypothetical protein
VTGAKSTIGSLNPQSATKESAIRNPHSDTQAYMPLIFVTVATRLIATM